MCYMYPIIGVAMVAWFELPPPVCLTEPLCLTLPSLSRWFVQSLDLACAVCLLRQHDWENYSNKLAIRFLGISIPAASYESLCTVIN